MSERRPTMDSPDAPRLRVLTDEKVQSIHDATLQLLEDPGCCIMSEEAREMLLGAGCKAADKNAVSIPTRVVEEALASAPRRFALHDRNGDERLQLGEGRAHFGTGVTALYYIDPDTSETREFTLEDIGSAARVTDALPNLDFATTPGVVKPKPGLELELMNQREFLAMVTNTTKPLMVLIANATSLADIFEMAAVVAGGRERLRQRPFAVPYLNPVTPLMFNPETLDKLLLAADWGVPVVCEAAPQIGATGPASIAGTMVVAAAETLCGLVVSQVRNPGTPYISGVVPMAMDMRTGAVANGGAAAPLMMMAMAEMCHRWGLPLVGITGTDSKIPDEQATLDTVFGTLSDVLSGVDLIFDVGNLEGGLIFSPELTVINDEVISMARGFLCGVRTDGDAIPMETIRSVGIGGQYLSQQHTLDHFREMWMPTLLDWQPRHQWEEAGSPTLRDRARLRTLELLAHHEVPPLPADTLAAMQAIIDTRAEKLENQRSES